jgi:hypothetical protein
VVSTGTADGVTRRIHVVAQSPRANAIFAESTVLSDEDIVLDGNGTIVANSATNHNIVLNNNSVLCGVAQYGVGMGLLPEGASTGGSNGNYTCDQQYPETTGNLSLPLVDQGEVADPDNNDNDHIDPANPLAPDTISGNGQVSWNPDTRTLVLASNATLTLGGRDYSFCRLELNSNTALIVAQGAQVRIFFDAPENCPGFDPAVPQILLDSNSRLTTTSGSPGDLQLLVVGSDTIDTDIVMNSNSHATMPVTLYAPRSDIELDSNSTLLGAVAGRSLHLDSNATVLSHTDGSNLEIPLPLHYRQTQFVECASTPAPTAAPSANC